MIEAGFGIEEDYNCAEKILYGANIAYGMNLSESALKMSAAFGGGMGIEDKCGALTAGLMVLSQEFTNTVAHQSGQLRPITNEFLNRYTAKMGSLDCAPLKEYHKTEAIGCKLIILEAARILDELMEKHNH
jgi:C_GCAxxG_C_C family probable redox protein